MKPAVIVVDMLKDTFKERSQLPITREARKILPNIQKLLEEGRKRGFPIIYACDSFLKEDFIFRGKTGYHSLQGTEGADVVDDLKPDPGDTILPKRRFSAFFKTDLDRSLQELGVDTIVVTGITTEVCVLTTALDGLCHDFYVILLEDCVASSDHERRIACLGLFRESTLYPLMRVMTVSGFLEEAQGFHPS